MLLGAAVGQPTWVSPCGGARGHGGHESCDRRGVGVGRDTGTGHGAGCGRGSGTGVGVASGRDVVEIQALGLPNLLLETDA